MSRLITATLVGAVKWYKTCPASWKEKAVTDLKNQLGRVKTPLSPAVKLGIRFEDAVVSATKLKPEEVKGTEHFKWVVDEVRNGQFQRVTNNTITIDGQTYCLYGKEDAYFPTIIKDIKTTSSYKGPEKYTESFQHKLYCYNERISCFRYLVAEFDANEQLIAHHAIDIDLPKHDELEKEVISTIKEVISFLSQHTELFALYTNVFSKH